VRRLTVATLILLGGAAAGCEDARVIDARGGGSSVSGPGAGGAQTGSGAVTSCGATCFTPAGTVQPVTTPEEVYAAIQGRWLFCRGWSGSPPPGVVGVEFGPASAAPVAGGSTAGGSMYYLVPGPSGPVRGQGPAYELTYDVSQETPIYCQLNMHPTPNSGFAGSVRYSPCPTEVQIDFGGPSDQRPILVPVDGAATVAPPPAPTSAGAAPTVAAGCGATCGHPGGTSQMLLDASDIYAALAGSWRVCSGWPSGFAPSNVVGVEFGPASTAPSFNGGTVGGNLYYLVDGPSGPVRGQGFDYQLTYDVSEAQLNIHPSPNSGLGGPVAFSSCPAWLDLGIGYGPSSVLVPFQ
jgi:hypothetical protein